MNQLKEKASKLFHENLRTVKDWPKAGIEFIDIFKTVTSNSELNSLIINCFKEQYADKGIGVIAGLEARGFIFGAQLAYAMNLPFVPIRKLGKSPPPVVQVEYELEYGTDTIEIESMLISKGDRVLIVDDLIATGGTAQAATNLLKKIGASVQHFACIVELSELPWKTQVLKEVEVFFITSFPKK
ncbi:MAG: adenine phosphoribosyltransferase [Bdellovibrionota bacterium]